MLTLNGGTWGERRPNTVVQTQFPQGTLKGRRVPGAHWQCGACSGWVWAGLVGRPCLCRPPLPPAPADHTLRVSDKEGF